MIFFYTLISIYIAWIWVDYYRLIDVYQKDALKYFILTFFLGALSVLLVFGIENTLFSAFPFSLNDGFLHDLLYSTFKIGLVEELAKLIPFILIYKVFRFKITEPLDYVAYICVSALGFSAAENTMYFHSEGAEVIQGRAVLATIGHMTDSALLIYGYVLYKYHPRKFGLWIVPLFVFLAAFSHGFYDFWLLYKPASVWGGWVTLLYFLITITLFATILNNALNNSPFFTYKKVINPNLVFKRLMTYYFILFVIQHIVLGYQQNALIGVMGFISSIFFPGLILIVCASRLGRFKLVKERWEPLRLSLPFVIESQNTIPGTSLNSSLQLRVKGDSFNETYINNYYEEYFFLCPVSYHNSALGKPHIAYIEEKIFLYGLDSYYIARLYSGEAYGPHRKILLKPKTTGNTFVNEEFPIVAVLKINDIELLSNPNTKASDFEFKEWAFIKPAPKEWRGYRVSDDNLPEPEAV